ncbi:MAG: tripartite tricarboxylate transporter substrate binding protein [Alphaproteobacteria bacterium]|nr:tripartite tricarboxylate transporter substrate binding protein [Alphaproteobacteria bacterium]
MKFIKPALASLRLAGIVATGSVAQASTYPDKPVTVIVPFNPGGGTDRQARMVEKEFKEEFGQPLAFVYKTGASGAIGATELTRAKPDGQTIAVYTFPLIVMNALTGKGQYTPDSFDYLAVASSDDVVLITAKESKYKTFESLLAAAKANPGKISVGSVESLGPTHIAALSLKEKGVDVNIVPFPGGAKGLAGVLGGHIDALFALRGAVRGSASKLNYLAIATDKRHPDAPDVPTLKEKGYDVTSSAARIWIAPKGLPSDVRNRLIGGLRNIYARKDVKERQAKAGQIVNFADGDALKAMIDDFTPMAKAMVKKYGNQ